MDRVLTVEKQIENNTVFRYLQAVLDEYFHLVISGGYGRYVVQEIEDGLKVALQRLGGGYNNISSVQIKSGVVETVAGFVTSRTSAAVPTQVQIQFLQIKDLSFPL